MKKQYLTILYSLIFVLFTSLSFAQTAAVPDLSPAQARSLSNQEWKKNIDTIKADTKTLLGQNEKLNSEYAFLNEKLAELQETISGIKKEIADQEEENKSLRNYSQDQKKLIGNSRAKIEMGEKEAEEIEKRKKELLKQLTIAQNNTRLQQEKLDALQAEKRELTLDLKMQEYYQSELKSDESTGIKKMKEQMERTEKDIARLSQIAEDLQLKKQQIPQQINASKRENKDLESQLSLLERQRRDKINENERLVKKNERLANLASKIPSGLLSEKRRLENDVKEAEAKLESVKKAVAESASVLEQKRGMMDEIMNMDSNNQEMREKITEILNQISALKKEIAQLDGEM